MYDFSAPHLYSALKKVLRDGASMNFVYDGKKAAHVGSGTKVDDKTEEEILKGLEKIAGRRFNAVPAWIKNGGLFANAYHIKVAVKDKDSFWLSSGNWQSSNQPNINAAELIKRVSEFKKYNREWHVVATCPALAKVFHRFIEWDFEQSQNAPEATFIKEILPELLIPEDYVLEEEERDSRKKLQLFQPKQFVFTI